MKHARTMKTLETTRWFAAAATSWAILLLAAALPATAQWDQCLPGEERAFSPGPYGTGYYDTAADFTVPTVDGDWNFQANWPSCDNYVFLGYQRNNCYTIMLWQSSVLDLLNNSPRNTQYFSSVIG